jgi:hypothetical protein
MTVVMVKTGPFREANITIPPDAYTVIDPGATPVLDFHMTVERGNHHATYASSSANFAVRTFARGVQETGSAKPTSLVRADAYSITWSARSNIDAGAARQARWQS